MTVIKDVYNEPAIDQGKPMTVQACCVVALQQVFPNEEASVETKLLRAKLAIRLAQDEGVIPPFKAEEVAEIKKCVGKMWNPIVVYRVFEALDPESVK